MPKQPSQKSIDEAHNAAERLHHLSMAYVGSLCELAQGKQLGMIPKNYPGLRQCRDFLDLILLCRAEISALTQCLVDAGVLDHEKVINQFAKDYEWIGQQKCKQFGCEITDVGLSYKIGHD